MGPFGSQTLESLMLSQQQMQRCRNNSGGSMSSIGSSLDIPSSPAATTAGAAVTPNDLGAITLLLSMKENLNAAAAAAESNKAASSAGGSGSSRYKTEMCRSFMETGQCKYGDKCQFAHGNHEQRALPRHPKYKTEYCRTYHTTGLCPYGTRCHFIHNEDPAKLDAIMRAKHQFIAQQAAQEMAKQAAQLRAQQSVIAGQINMLVSQVQHTLATNMAVQNTVNSVLQQHSQSATSTTTRAPQLPAVNPLALHQLHQLLALQQQSRLAATQQQQQASLAAITAATAATTTTSTPLSHRGGSLGSVADTPPVSPPCGSPVFDESCSSSNASMTSLSPKSCDVSPPPGFAPLRRAGAEKSAFFDFSSVAMSRAATITQVPYSSVNNNNNGVDTDFMSQVLCDLQALELESSSSAVSSAGSNGYTPPSSPDSFCQSPMDSPRMSRLPIFRGLAGDA